MRCTGCSTVMALSARLILNRHLAKGGLGFSKYASVETKMNPVIDDLLVNY